MTSGSLFFKLMREDMKRRIWVIALMLLAFFFAMPVKLALLMEDAAQNQYYRYNDFVHFIQDGTLSAQEFASKLTELKTKVVLEQVEFADGLVVLLVITAAVLIGMTGFSYLYNKRKVDFYHSIPVRREFLFGVQYIDGILITAGVYLLVSVVTAVMSVVYGVPLGRIIGVMVRSGLLHLLYFGLLYSTVVLAVMMTGNLVVGVLGTGVFFFFLPGVMALLDAYCRSFFVTIPYELWTSPFEHAVYYVSPISAYLGAVGWDMESFGSHVAVVVNTFFAFLALSLLDLQLYRMRPSEAAGKAMAFKKSMAPVRILLVLGGSLAGSMFFWGIMRKNHWAVFGALAAVVLGHCIIEIIYHFDFRKLFSHRLQLGLCAAAGLMLFFSFRYDWYGFDSYMPENDKIASVSMELGADTDWLSGEAVLVEENGREAWLTHRLPEMIRDDMEITELSPALVLAEEGRKETLEGREDRMEIQTQVYSAMAMVHDSDASAVGIIGGADGPTAVFTAGKLGTDEGALEKDQFRTFLTITYHLKNGRSVRRRYTLYLSNVMDAYRELWDQEEYRNKVYYVLDRSPEEYGSAVYREAGVIQAIRKDSQDVSEILLAYQQDLKELTIDTRLKESPVGSLAFINKTTYDYYAERYDDHTAFVLQGDSLGRMDSEALGATDYWPVYPSFKRTIAALESREILPGTYLKAEDVSEIQCWVSLPLSEEEIQNIQAVNPYYHEDGDLLFKGREEISLLLDASVIDDEYHMNILNREAALGDYINLSMDYDRRHNFILLQNKLTPELLELFRGLPVPAAGEL